MCDDLVGALESQPFAAVGSQRWAGSESTSLLLLHRLGRALPPHTDPTLRPTTESNRDRHEELRARVHEYARVLRCQWQGATRRGCRHTTGDRELHLRGGVVSELADREQIIVLQ